MTTTQLVRYEQARHALAECKRVDEVKDIRDKSEAMAAYARQAKDTELVEWATEIKVRAERKAGEMLAVMEKAKGGDPTLYQDVRGDRPATLAELGLTQNQSSRYQSLASMTDEHFETAVATAKDTAGQVTTAFMLREAAKNKPQGKPKTGPKAEALREELKAAKERGVSLLETYARLTLSALREQDSFMSGRIATARGLDLFCRGLVAFDQSNARLTRIVIQDVSKSLDNVREFVLSEMKKTPDQAGETVAKPSAKFNWKKVA